MKQKRTAMCVSTLTKDFLVGRRALISTGEEFQYKINHIEMRILYCHFNGLSMRRWLLGQRPGFFFWGGGVSDRGLGGVSGRGLGSRQWYVYSHVYRVCSTRQKSGLIHHHLEMTPPTYLCKNRPCSMETHTPYAHNDKLLSACTNWNRILSIWIEFLSVMFNFVIFVLFVSALFVLVEYLFVK